MAYQQIHGRRETFGAEESEDLTEYAYGVWMGDNPRRMMLYGLISILYGTGMRVGEALQLKYDAVQHTDGVACEITIKPETTKVRKERKIIANVWDTIDWLYKKFGNDLFSHPSIKVVNASMVGHQFDVLLDDYNSSHPVNQISTDLTLYSFRHQFLTERAENPNINVLELAIYCGTSVDQLQKHYYHQTDKIKEKIALNLSSPLLR
jgi:integrase